MISKQTSSKVLVIQPRAESFFVTCFCFLHVRRVFNGHEYTDPYRGQVTSFKTVSSHQLMDTFWMEADSRIVAIINNCTNSRYLCIAQNIVWQRHIGSHVCFLSRIQVISKIDTLREVSIRTDVIRKTIKHTLLETKVMTGSRSAITKAPHLMKGNFPDGDMCSALILISTLTTVQTSQFSFFSCWIFATNTWKSNPHIRRNTWTAKELAWSCKRICSTSYGWYSLTSEGHGSEAVKSEI